MKSFKECQYAAFISYAHADDDVHFSWITDFEKELRRGLGGRLNGMSGIAPLKLHLSGDNGPVSGVLSDELRQRVADSFVMIIVVHENYARSAWCLKELEYFKSLFGDEGLRKRLYIVALSRSWMKTVQQRPSWKQLCPNEDLIWKEFFKEDDDETPIPVYMAPQQVAPAFQKPFAQLRDDLVKRIKADLEQPSVRPAPPSDSDDGVLIYIESNQNELDLWEPLGEHISQKWDRIVEDMHVAPRLFIRPRGLPIDQIAQHPPLDDADGVVLLWGKKEPDALVSQINKVERKLAGRDVAPGIVAYLMPPQPNPESSVPAWGWKVLRFATEPRKVDVVAEEADQLNGFLKKILARTHKRRASSLAAERAG
jgi:TIR domain